MAKQQGWQWMQWGFAIDGPEFSSFASNVSEAENEISDAMRGTKYDRDDYTIMPVYARTHRGPAATIGRDPWSLETQEYQDGT